MRVLLISALVAILDQWTKYLVRSHFALAESRPILEGFFSLTYVRNTGAAWGMLGGHNMALTLVSLLLLAALVLFRRSFLSDTWAHRLALGLLMGGVVGNLADRLRLGWVTDFLDFYFRGYHWPAFNVADAAICIGVGIYMITTFRSGSASPTSTPAPDHVGSNVSAS